MTGKAPNWRQQERIAAVVASASAPSGEQVAWLEHLSRTCRVPFAATCGSSSAAEPLGSGGLVQVIGFAAAKDRGAGVLAKVMDGQRSVLVPLERLSPREVEPVAAEAVADWYVWYAESAARREA